MKHFLFVALFLFFATSAQKAANAEGSLAKYQKFEIDISHMLKKRAETNFSAFTKVKRSSAANLYQRALPSVVKVLTNDGSGSGVIISDQGNGYLITKLQI